MKNKRKKIILGIIGITMIFLLTGCNNKTEVNNVAENNVTNSITNTNENNTSNTQIANQVNNTNNITNETTNSEQEENTITKEQAEELLKSKFGTVGKETNFPISYGYMSTVKDKEGTKYYAFRMTWLVDNSHSSFLNTILVSVDGKKYKEISMSAYYEDGETVTEFDSEGTF